MRRAFTAVELMIVVAVLLIMMGILLPAISAIREKSRIRLTEQRVQGMRMAFERYRNDVGVYPPSSTDYAGINAHFDPASIYLHLCGPDNKGLVKDGKVYGPYITFKSSELRRLPSGLFEVLDPWGRPYVYVEHRSHFHSTEVRRLPPKERQIEIERRKATNPDSFDLFSLGPDGETPIPAQKRVDS